MQANAAKSGYFEKTLLPAVTFSINVAIPNLLFPTGKFYRLHIANRSHFYVISLLTKLYILCAAATLTIDFAAFHPLCSHPSSTNSSPGC